MSQGFANEGQIFKQQKLFSNLNSSSVFSVGLYSNAADTLNQRSQLAAVTPIGGTGYAAIELAANSWSFETLLGVTPASDVVRALRGPIIFTATAAWGTVRGAYLFHAASGTLIAWKDAPADYPMPSGAKYWVDLADGLFQT